MPAETAGSKSAHAQPGSQTQPGAAEAFCQPAGVGAEATAGSPGEPRTLPALGLQRPQHADGPVGSVNPRCVGQAGLAGDRSKSAQLLLSSRHYPCLHGAQSAGSLKPLVRSSEFHQGWEAGLVFRADSVGPVSFLCGRPGSLCGVLGRF